MDVHENGAPQPMTSGQTTPPMAAQQTPYGTTTPRATDEARKAALAQHVASAVATQGARVESQSDFQAVLVTGHPVNHVLHVIVTLVTCGLWVFPWLFFIGTGGEKRHLVQVDEWGNVRVQHV